MRAIDRLLKTRPDGFTLIEVLVALLLVIFLLLPAMSSIASLLANRSKGDVRAEALEVARSTIEAVKTLGAGAFSEQLDPDPVKVAGPGGHREFDVKRVMRVLYKDSHNPSHALWEVTVFVYEHPASDDATPLCSLTTFLYPQ